MRKTYLKMNQTILMTMALTLPFYLPILLCREYITSYFLTISKTFYLPTCKTNNNRPSKQLIQVDWQ